MLCKMQWRRALVCVAAGVTVVAAQTGFGTRTVENAEVPYIPRPAAARVLALGQEALLADLYWLRAVQMLGASRRPAEHAVTVGQLVDVVTRLDPYVDHPYRFAAIWMNRDLDNIRDANRILRRGVSYHPREWRNRFYLSFNHFFYLDEQQVAADELEPAIHLPGSPTYLGRLLARLRSESGGGLEVAEAYLRQLIESTHDESRRADYEKALDEIETEKRARFLDRARERYIELHGRDIERVEDLVTPPDGVLVHLPPEPHGWEWEIDARTGEIASGFLNGRYNLHFAPGERERRQAWLREGKKEDSR